MTSSKTARTVRIRVQVAVDAQGRWYAYGYHNATQDDAQSVIYDMADSDDIAWRWLTAEIEVPQGQEVAADVEY